MSQESFADRYNKMWQNDDNYNLLTGEPIKDPHAGKDPYLVVLQLIAQGHLPWKAFTPEYYGESKEADKLGRLLLKNEGLEGIHAGDIYRFKNPHWYNDNIINCYITLLRKKIYDTEEYIFKTYSWSSWLDSKKCSSKVDIFNYNQCFWPINKNSNHWILLELNIKKKKILIYDSFPSNEQQMKQYITKNLNEYLIKYQKSKVKNKKVKKQKSEEQKSEETNISIKDWPIECILGKPRQRNGYDCGVFMLENLRCLILKRSINFKQNDIMKIRKRIFCEIFTQEIKVYNNWRI